MNKQILYKIANLEKNSASSFQTVLYDLLFDMECGDHNLFCKNEWKFL